jgi:antitoxin component of RelBE/YafQ-DinJ toxin-antitoxin module
MTYITIDTKTAQAKKLVELIETLPFAKIIKEPNAVTKKAIEDARKGKTRKASSIKQLFAELNK